jgi:hypothetical protein
VYSVEEEDDEEESLWDHAALVNHKIIELLEHPHIGIQVYVIKHLQIVASVYSTEKDDDKVP